MRTKLLSFDLILQLCDLLSESIGRGGDLDVVTQDVQRGQDIAPLY